MLDSSLDRLTTLAGDVSATMLDAALAVNVCLHERLDEAAVRSELVRLAAEYGGNGTPWAFLRNLGFGGQPPADVVAGSRLDAVLESRRGLPITLAALVAHLAQTTGLEARGINFPGHFLLRVDRTLVDPFALEARSEAECLASLPQDADPSGALEEAGPRDVLLRMFNNLKYFHLGRAEYHRALEMVDCQLRVLPGHAGLVFEQGEYWLRLGSVQGAKAAFEKVLSTEGAMPDATLKAMARRRLEELGGRSDTLH